MTNSSMENDDNSLRKKQFINDKYSTKTEEPLPLGPQCT